MRPRAVFAIDSGIDVVQDGNGAIEGVFEHGGERNVFPTQVDCDVDDALVHIHWAGATDTE